VRLLQLSLRNYRNYSRLDLEPGAGLNVFLGRNGQGKTNLLESVALLALSSSPRTRRDAELIGPIAAEARVDAHVESAKGVTEIGISVARQEGERSRRSITVNGVARRAVDLPGHFRVTLFWPDDLGLIKSGPENRRRLLNQLLVQVESGYARLLSRYSRVLEQRNSLLKQVMGGEQPASALDVWDLELSATGTEISRARSVAVLEMDEHARRNHPKIAPGESLELLYLGPPQDLAVAVQNSRPEDLRRGMTSVGPHRDDVEILLGGKDARSYASQGQQRSAVVSLKLAEAALIARRTGESPVLLLDDVLSELDAERRLTLLGRVGEQEQVIITSVEAGPFPPDLMARASVRCIEAGEIGACG
jgi:DNA replication and repair protein RecF